MSVDAVQPFRFPTWLQALFELLSFTRVEKPLTAVPAEVPPELAALLAIGRHALGAHDLKDLNARLDAAVMELRTFSIPASDTGAVTFVVPDLKLTGEPGENSRGVRMLGRNVTGKLLQGLREGVALLHALKKALDEVAARGKDGAPHASWVFAALSVRPWSLHEGAVVPHTLVDIATQQCRGFVAVGAILAVLVDGRRPEPWLASALADAWLNGVRETARIVASGGYDVGPRKPEGLLNLEALFREAEEADAAFLAGFASDVRAGLVGVPEDE
ncbi:Hypothetical protein CAP_6574 [Chondromyces apiculatus DSM 436]|uniref:Uncharacterized protein n=2 Tax=Chondromyces apiculatus TaxID=51 RepID=A0A017T0B6_9BACT|nr:Hypothetical protein CAP_6574 [Chondromyces apiculatus DSM 436]